MKVTKAIILAGGRGTRFLPFAKIYAKEMLPVGDMPALQFLIREVVSAGITDILAVVNPEKKHIARYFQPDKKLNAFLHERCKKEELYKVSKVCEGADLRFLVQKNQTGSGGAVALCKKFIGGQPFAFLNGDDLIFAKESVTLQLVREFNLTARSIIGVQKIPPSDLSKCGVADVCDVNGRRSLLNGVMEKPSFTEAPSDLALLGRSVFAPSFLPYLSELSPSVSGELLITDAINLQAKSEIVFAYEFEGKRFDLGNKLGFAKAAAWNMAVHEKNEEYLDFLKNLPKD